jgi:hypothetical protein
MKNLLLENSNDFLANSMTVYIKKSKLVYYKKYSHFTIWGYSIKNNNIFNLCGESIKKLYNDLLKDFNIKLKHLNIILVDCPEHRKFIDSFHYINGGFTFLNKNFICIYRYDEMLKVALHEVIHHAFYFKEEAIYLGDPIRSKVNINFNEALVEFLATLYQIKYTNNTVIDELKHSLQNVKIVLSMPNMVFTTQIYSYIVIKHLLLKKHKLILNYIKNKHYDRIYQYVYNTKINIKPSIIKKTSIQKKKLTFVLASYV